MENLISNLVSHEGQKRIAELCGVSRVAVSKWAKAGRLPRTEFTGETEYAEILASEFGFDAAHFLEQSRLAWLSEAGK